MVMWQTGAIQRLEEELDRLRQHVLRLEATAGPKPECLASIVLLQPPAAAAWWESFVLPDFHHAVCTVPWTQSMWWQDCMCYWRTTAS